MPIIPTTQGTESRLLQSACGVQDRIVILAVPTNASAALVNQPLAGQTLTVNGDYECLIPLAGLTTAVEVHTTATLTTKTASTDLDTLFWVSDLDDPTTWVEKTAASGTGALSTTVRQTATLASLRGEQFARYTLTVAGAAGSVLVTQAEYNAI